MKKILVIHGPNLNLLGLLSAQNKTRFTLDKINKYLRNVVQNTEYSLKIIQTHNEAKVITFLHKNYKFADGILLSPGVWNNHGFILKNTIDIIKLPYVIIRFKKELSTIFDKNYIITNSNPKIAYVNGIKHLFKII